MNNTTYWIVGIIGVILLVGAYFFPSSTNTTTVQNVGSAAGTTSNTAKFAGVVAVPSAPGANATSSSILNGDAGDRYITSVKVGCESVGTSKTAYTGAGLASLQVTMSTTSTAAPTAGGTTISTITIATSTPTFLQASSTASGTSGTGSFLYIWQSGSYLTFTTNATNTATCTFGGDYFQS